MLVGLVWAPIGIAAAIGLALLTIGAIAYHVRTSDTVAELAPAVIGVATGPHHRRAAHPLM